MKMHQHQFFAPKYVQVTLSVISPSSCCILELRNTLCNILFLFFFPYKFCKSELTACIVVIPDLKKQNESEKKSLKHNV